jgi:hypothetical protein
MTSIDKINDLQMTRKHILEHLHRPPFESFRQNSMVCVSACFFGDFESLVKSDAFNIDEKSNKFRNCNSRVGIVKLDRNFLVKLIELNFAAKGRAKFKSRSPEFGQNLCSQTWSSCIVEQYPEG